MSTLSGPTVTVIIPAFNAGKYLGEALDSLLCQTLPPSQIIVVDDGSTDQTPDVLQSYRTSIVAVRQENNGAGAARNNGLRRATGQYVAFLDADDVSAPERLQRQATSLQARPDAVACFTGFWTFDVSRRLGEFPMSDLPADSLDFLGQCQFGGLSLMFDRARTAGLYFPEDDRVDEDVIFSAKVATRGRVIAVPEILYGYRSHPTQRSIGYRVSATSNRSFENRYEWSKAHWREYWPDRSWADVERKLWYGLAHQTEAAYWARHKGFFLNDRAYLRKNWPSHLPRPEVLRWRWYPDWLWQVKNSVDSRIRSRA
jgi:glycosyltransferase involved in cell wall biosynthesis